MSFKLLRQVIAHLRKMARCPSCSSRFDEDFIFVLATSAPADNTGCNALFFVVCRKCSSGTFVFIEVTPSLHTNGIAKNSIRMETKAAGRGISVNEVLDMHNFLKNWQGDVKELFT